MNFNLQSIVKNSWRFGAVFAASVAVSAPAVAQDDDPIFEEIVVLATKRAESIMEVPVAVSTVSGMQIQDAGIKDVWDLQQNVPGLIIGRSQTATTTNFAIRGIGSTSNNFGVESSVGLYVDGVYRSRQSSMINDLVDVEAVEVLRGPQGTLFGKNTAAGAITIRSVRPSQESDAFVDLTAGDLGLIKLAAGGNFSLNDDWASRVTVFSAQRDGYVDDPVFGKDAINDKDRMGVRLQFANGEPGDDFNMRIVADYSEIDETCCVAVNRVDSLYYRGSIAAGTPTPGSDAAILALGGTVFTNFPYPAQLLAAYGGQPGTIVTNSGFEDYRTAVNSLPVSENEDMGLSLEMEWILENGTAIKSITGYRSFETFDSIDGDFSNVDIFSRTNTAEQESFSQEFQWTGEFGNGHTFVTGLYYFQQEIDQFTTTDTGPFFGTYAEILRPDLAAARDGVTQVSLLTGGLIPPGADAFPIGTASADVVVQDQSGYAAFGQFDFALSDQFALTLGLRYTDEDKDIDAVYAQTAAGPAPDLDAIALNLGLAAMGMQFDPAALIPVTQPGWGSYLFDPLAPRPDLNDSISDDQTTGTIKLTYFPTDSSMLYASFASGFKSGGTNTDRINPTFDSTFNAETSESIELGYKGTFGPVQLVATVYQTEFDDFQANSFTGTGFNLQNAGALTIDGFELEARWRPTDSTQIEAFYARNNGEYDSFEAGTGWDTWVVHTGQWLNPQQGDPGCTSLTDPDGERPDSCSRSGEAINYNPEDRAFLAITQDFNISNNVSMFIRGEYTFIGEQTTDGDGDPFSTQDDVSLVNLRLGFNFDNINSTLTFWGRNITDERYYHGSFDVPVAEDKMYSYPSEPATYGVTFFKNFD